MMEERYKVDVLTLRGELLYRRTFPDFNSANVMFENQLNDDDHFIAYTPYDVLMISLDHTDGVAWNVVSREVIIRS